MENHPATTEIHLQDYLAVIRRRRRTVIFSALAVMLLVILYLFLTPPLYEGTATLHVSDDKMRGGLLGDLGLTLQNPVETEIEILKSRSIAEEVVRRLHLDWQIDHNRSKGTIHILEFGSSNDQPRYTIIVTGINSFDVHDSHDKRVGSGVVGQLMRGEGITLLIGQLTYSKGDQFRLSLLPFNDTVEKLRQAVTVRESKRKTNIISLAYRDVDPERALEVANTLVQVYLEQSVNLKTQEASRTLDFITENISSVRQELDRAERDLEQYKSQNGIVQLDAEATSLVERVSESERQQTELTLTKRQLQFAMQELKEAIARGTPYVPTIMKDEPLLAEMATRLADLELKKRALLAEFREAHPTVKVVQDEIDEVRAKILNAYQSSIDSVKTRELALKKIMGNYESTMSHLPTAERELASRFRVAKVNADIYTFLLQKHEEARIARASTTSNISIIDPAILPEKPVQPKRLKTLLVGFAGAIFLALGLAFFQEYLDDTIKDDDTASRVLGLPVLAIIPRFITLAGTGPIVQREPRSPATEAFRGLRTSLHFAGINRQQAIILATSAFPGEGKSTVVVNLALVQAQTGKRILLIDGDLRRPSLHEKLVIRRSPGLTELLVGDASQEQVIQQSGIAGIDVIAGGATPPNPAELLCSERMRQLLTELSGSYDQIIIDAPPVLAVTDAPLLTSLTQMVFIVLELGRVPLKAAQRLKEVLGRIEAPVIGLVLNDKEGTGEASYGYYGYGENESPKHNRLWQRLLRKLSAG